MKAGGEDIGTFGRPGRIWICRTGGGERPAACVSCVLVVTHALSLRASSPAAEIFL